MTNWKEKALAHAKEEDPRESCGLLLNIKGKEIYYPCKNLAAANHHEFVLDVKDYVKASDKGEVIAIVHSHPTTPAHASQADLISCEHSKKPWYIVNPRMEEWCYFEPSGYKPSLLGRRYIWGVNDCYSVVVDWYKEKRGITLKDYPRNMTPEEFQENPLFEDYAWRTGFRQLRDDEKLEEGDLLFMSIFAPTLSHVAIFTEGMVLHHLTDRLSCREPYSEFLLKSTKKRYRYVKKS